MPKVRMYGTFISGLQQTATPMLLLPCCLCVSRDSSSNSTGAAMAAAAAVAVAVAVTAAEYHFELSCSLFHTVYPSSYGFWRQIFMRRWKFSCCYLLFQPLSHCLS
jgi:hypothetical protein